MNELRTWVLPIGAIVALASVAGASTVTYNVDLNTSTIAGTTGFLDFQFNPVAGAPASNATLGGFTLGGGSAIGLPVLDGDATGSLGTSVVLRNTTSLNAFLQSILFGSSVRFTVSLSGPALDPPG